MLITCLYYYEPDGKHKERRRAPPPHVHMHMHIHKHIHSLLLPPFFLQGKLPHTKVMGREEARRIRMKAKPEAIVNIDECEDEDGEAATGKLVSQLSAVLCVRPVTVCSCIHIHSTIPR